MDLVVTVDRAPQRGETVPGHSLHTVPGGKGANQALAAARAGGTVTFLGAVGDDDTQTEVTRSEGGMFAARFTCDLPWSFFGAPRAEAARAMSELGVDPTAHETSWVDEID